MKKLIFGMIITVLIFSIVSCAEKPTTTPPPAPVPQPATPTPAPAQTTVPSPAPVPPGSEPPGTPGAVNDDIVSAPGGFTYRASIHQEGQPDWPSVLQSETSLTSGSQVLSVRYRSYIETKAGETRNNIIFLDARNAPEITDPLQINYRPESLRGIVIERGQQMYGGIGGQDKKSSRVVLKIRIAPDVKQGEYSFALRLEYDGKDLGSLPCTVKVLN